MKTRWRDIFLKAFEIHPTFALEVIAACATLHNICLGVGDIFPAEERQEESDQEEREERDVEVEVAHGVVNGNVLRDHICLQVNDHF